MITIIKPDFVFEDERGSLVQLVHEGFRQINSVRSLPGSARGGHYHAFNREAFYVVSGSFDVTASLGEESETRRFSTGDMFIIEKNVVHSMNYLEETVLVVMYDVGVELPGGGKDIIPAQGFLSQE